MKRSAVLLAILSSFPILAGPPEQPRSIRNDPPYVSTGTVPAPTEEKFVYGEQTAVAGRPVLVSPDAANNLLARFKAAYPKLGNPRFVLYVNRDLVDENSGLRVTGRTERTEVTANGEKTTNENTYKLNEKTVATLNDKQTVRDVERLFGRPLRMAGASLVDQKIASQMIHAPLKELQGGSEQAHRDREALGKVADVALEILVSSHNVTVSELSGDNTYVLPDIQATAVRLSDARVLGQATAADVIGKAGYAGTVARNFDVREISEATALALMEDLLLNVPQ